MLAATTKTHALAWVFGLARGDPIGCPQPPLPTKYYLTRVTSATCRSSQGSGLSGIVNVILLGCDASRPVAPLKSQGFGADFLHACRPEMLCNSPCGWSVRYQHPDGAFRLAFVQPLMHIARDDLQVLIPVRHELFRHPSVA